MRPLTAAQRGYLTDLAAGRPRGCANRRDASTAFSLRDRGLITISCDGVALTAAGRQAVA